MKTLEKVSDFVGKYMAAIVIVVAAGALFFPGPFSVVKTSWVNTLLGVVMFGMGLTLKPNDFKVVFSRPKDVIVGCVAQFTLMPFLAWVLTMVFHLPTELAIGVILGPIFEKNLRRAESFMTSGPAELLHHPIALVILVITVVMIIFSLRSNKRAAEREAAVAAAEEQE